MAIVSEAQTYIPEFNIQNQKYEDKCPIPARARGFIYKCKCTNTGTIFTSLTEFNIHRKNRGHKDFIEHYLDRVKETSEYINIIKHNQIKIELLTRENEKLQKEITQLNKTIIEKERQFKFMNEVD
jgi:hypothetical protein